MKMGNKIFKGLESKPYKERLGEISMLNVQKSGLNGKHERCGISFIGNFKMRLDKH